MSDSKELQHKVKQPWSTPKKITFTILMIPVGFVALAIIVGVVATIQNPPRTTTDRSSAKSEQAATIGQKVSDGGFDFVVNSVKCGEKRISYNDGVVEHYAEAQGQFCRLNLTITNNGDSANSTRHYYQQLLNTQGQKYDADSGATGRAAKYDLGNPFDDDINPGNSITGDIVFDVPLDVRLHQAELHGASDSKGVRVSL